MSEQEHEKEIEETGQEVSPVALPGHRLRLTREDLHLSKDEVAHHLHLDVQIVEALETDNFDALPSPAYICGYLRSYARILKLPEDEIVNAYSKGQEINAALIPESVSIEPEKQMNPMITKVIVIIVLVLLVAAGFMWLADKFHMFDVATTNEPATINVAVPETSSNMVIERPSQVQEQIQQYNAEHSETTATETSTTENQETNSAPLLIDEQESSINATAVVVPANTGNLKLVFSENSWTEVTDSEGKRHVYRLVDKDTEIYVDGAPPYKVLLGNAEGVEVFYKNEIFNHKRYQRDQIAYFRLGKAEE